MIAFGVIWVGVWNWNGCVWLVRVWCWRWRWCGRGIEIRDFSSLVSERIDSKIYCTISVIVRDDVILKEGVAYEHDVLACLVDDSWMALVRVMGIRSCLCLWW